MGFYPRKNIKEAKVSESYPLNLILVTHQIIPGSTTYCHTLLNHTRHTRLDRVSQFINGANNCLNQIFTHV